LCFICLVSYVVSVLFVLCLMLPVFYLSCVLCLFCFICLVSYVASVSWLSILDFPFGFL
jgi:hypothetical protein